MKKDPGRTASQARMTRPSRGFLPSRTLDPRDLGLVGYASYLEREHQFQSR
jgi:hypothetical protein